MDAQFDRARAEALAYIEANPGVAAEDVVAFLTARLASGAEPPAPATGGFVACMPVADSISQDEQHIFCLVDGAKLKMLKRYIRRFGLTPDSYRAAFGLPDDYPMAAPAYSRAKRMEAARVGLGSDENKAGVNLRRDVGAEDVPSAAARRALVAA